MTPPTPPPVDHGRALAIELLRLVQARVAHGRRWSPDDTDLAEALCRQIGAHDLPKWRQKAAAGSSAETAP